MNGLVTRFFPNSKTNTLIWLVALATCAVLQGWRPPNGHVPPKPTAAVLQPVGSWNNLTAAQRLTLKNGGTVNGFASGICNAAGQNIALNITSGPAPNAPNSSAINVRHPRRWGNASFFMALKNMGNTGGVQYCFDLGTASAISVDSREHAYFAKGENVRVTATNAGAPVSLTASYQGGQGLATIFGNGTSQVHFNANGKVGGGLWWSVSSGTQVVSRVCVEYYVGAGDHPAVEPFRLSIDGAKCVADSPTTCSGSSPISRWGWLGANTGIGLDLGEPVYGFGSGFCDETGDPVNFIEIDADGASSSGNPELNNKPPRPYGRFSFDNSREYVGNGGSTYCFTLDEALPVRLNSGEHRLFAGAERVRVKAWLGADAVALTGFNNGGGPAPISNSNGLTFSGTGYGKGVWWEVSSGTQPVSQVCVEYWRVGGGALTGEPFALELCAPRCIYDDLYACSLNPNGTPGCANLPQVTLTKSVAPANSYGLNTCTNASGGVELPVFDVNIAIANNTGAVKQLFLEDDLLSYFGSSYVWVVSPPQILFSSASGNPLLDPAFDGINNTNIFVPGTGFLGAGQSISLHFSVSLNPNAAGAVATMCNTAFGGGYLTGGFVSTDLSGNAGGGAGTPTNLFNLPAGVIATTASDLTLEASLPNYMSGLQNWLSTRGGATFSVPGCSPITWTNNYNPANWVTGCGQITGHVDVTFTATDACGHTFTTCATFSLQDTQGPTCVKPTDLTLDCGDPDAASELDEWLNYSGSWTDLSQPVTFTHDFTGLTGSECNGGPVTVTWVGTDACGNQTTFVGYLTVVDNTAPVLQGVPANLTINACTAVPAAPSVTASDACDGNVAVVFLETITGTACNRTITRTWTATDDCGNETSASQSITIVDNISPLITNVPADTTVECPDIPPVQDPTVTDCSTFTVSFNQQQIGGACPLPSQIIRTWTATDACGNTTTVSQTITVTSPVTNSTLVFTFVPSDITTSCDQNPGFGDAVAETTCPAGGLSVSFTDVVNSNGDCSQPFSITRTWIAHDACGNMATASQTISTGPDTEAPVFANDTPSAITLDCGGQLYQPVAFDNCGATNLSYVDSGQSGSCAVGFSFTRTWTATDICRNASTFVQQVNTNPDTTAPVFLFVPYDQFFDCEDTIVFPNPVAFDNCGDVTITWQDSIIGTGDCHEVNGIEYGYDIVRTWTATDECGNTATATTSAWVLPGFNDGNRIAFSYVPADATINCGDQLAFGTPICHSACGDLTITHVDVANENCTTGRTVTRTWTATDVCGNTTFASQTITTAADLVPPVFTYVPANSTLTCGGGDPVFGTPLVTDNCANGTDITVTSFDFYISNGICLGQKVTRTWTAKDPCGNAATASQTLTIVDDAAPVFGFVPQNLEVACGQPVTFGTAQATDACTALTLEFHDEVLPGACTGSELHVRTWTAVDACGNTNQASQVIEVKDLTAPVFNNLPDDQTVSCGQPIEFGNPDITDGCSMVALDHTDLTTPGTCGGSYSTTRTWSAVDACGNFSQASQTIFVVDNVNPELSVPAGQLIECGDPVVFGLPTVSDCSQYQLTHQDEVQSATCGAVHTRTWTAVDACGNAVQASQTIEMVDSQAPVFVAMPDHLVMTAAEFQVWEVPVGTVEDCTGATVSMESAMQTDCQTETWFYEYTALDNCGNISSHTLSVEVTGTTMTAFVETPPSMNCDSVYSVEASVFNGEAPYTYQWTVAGSGWDITGSNDTPAILLGAGENQALLTLTVTDANGCQTVVETPVACSNTVLATKEAGLVGLEVFPNPVSGQLTVRFEAPVAGEAAYRVQNLLGEWVSEQQTSVRSGINDQQVDVSTLSAGTYLLTIRLGDRVGVRRFVKI